ncbi:zinc finger domain-containing protein [Halosimplex pelagicum]|uniref:DNA-binding phage zinc finger domain-containing protein n=1 Tax=Halosimplex pelagicum TaxID=869886 RepID=A0A7D5TGV7_9EURY|nr:hypothetical protein [Halosimplex pelagicum]QLH82136.1 hypothetical protein HZS54_11205 [Halosimplex pelagicum]
MSTRSDALEDGQRQRQSRSVPSVTFWTDTTEGSTFQSDKLRHWTESHLEDAERILNPCAGVASLSVDGEVLRVDVDEEADADLHIDFRDLPDHVETESFDAIVYDPPYTPNQARSKYGLDISDEEFYFYSRKVKALFDQLLAPGGVFIQFGYSTAAMPRNFGYQTMSVGLFNKLGSQNDYLGVAARKPTSPTQQVSPVAVTETVTQNAGANEIDAGDISTGGNGGNSIEMRYKQAANDTSFEDVLAGAVGEWVRPGDRVLHIFEDEPRVSLSGSRYTTCRYDCVDINSPDDPAAADVVETPWNIDARFGTGVFDVIVLDIPHSAFQRNIRTPQEEASGGSDVTHIDTALKRSLTDLVRGDGGRVVQIGRTATLMSGNDYDYHRAGVSILEHPAVSHDRVVAVDKKPHENLEIVGLGDGEVDRLHQHPHGAPGITSKHRRSAFEPTADSEFCVHCGNSFFHHPAAYVACPECGAAAGTGCVTEDGTPIPPSGRDHRITADDVHQDRLDIAAAKHSGDCNSKSPSYLDADPEIVSGLLDELSSSAFDREWGLLERKRLKADIEDRFTSEPRSIDLPERIIDELTGKNTHQKAAPASTSDTRSTSETSLDDFL